MSKSEAQKVMDQLLPIVESIDHLLEQLETFKPQLTRLTSKTS
jgi:molecular chaperone GrpE (heat shock protein)